MERIKSCTKEVIVGRNEINKPTIQERIEADIESAGFGVGTILTPQVSEKLWHCLDNALWMSKDESDVWRGISGFGSSESYQAFLTDRWQDPETNAYWGNIWQFENEKVLHRAYWTVEQGWQPSPEMKEKLWEKICRHLESAGNLSTFRSIWSVWEIYLDYLDDIEKMAEKESVVVILDELNREEREKIKRIKSFSIRNLLNVVG